MKLEEPKSRNLKSWKNEKVGRTKKLELKKFEEPKGRNLKSWKNQKVGT